MTTAVRAFSIGLRVAPARLAGYLLAMVAAGAVPVAIAWVTKQVIDDLANGQTSSLARLTAELIGLAVLAATLPHAARYVLAEFNRRASLQAQDRLYERVNRLSGLERFEDPRFHNRLRMAQQSGLSAPVSVIDSAIGMLRSLITAAGFLGSLFVVSKTITVLVLVSAVPVLLAELRLARERATAIFGLSGTERREVFYSNLLANLQAAKEIRLFGMGGLLRDRMRQSRMRSNLKRRSLDRRSVTVQGGLGLLSALVSGGGLFWAVLAAGRHEITIGDVSIFVAAVAGVQAGLGSLAVAVASVHQDLLNFQHYLDIMNTPADLPVPRDPKPVPALRTGIEFRDVWFRYSEQHPWVLRGVSFRLPFGESVGLVGLNGAGKSTIVKLLCRLYDPQRGQILWDGIDLREVRPEDLRHKLSAVFQDYMTYDLCARENIGLGDLASLDDMAAVRSAAAKAGVDAKLSGLPHGYETMLTRMFFDSDDEDGSGVLLSGGEWQRVALARSLVRHNAEVLILDEPSSGLDAEAEYQIHAQLRDLRRGRTSLLISHRLGTMRDADRIIVLGEGRIVESGSHAGLLASGGQYAELFKMQATGYQMTGPGIVPILR